MGSRADSMAAIDAALNEPTTSPEIHPLIPHAAPDITSTAKEPKEEKPKVPTPEELEKQAHDTRVQGFSETASKIGAIQGTVNTAQRILHGGGAALENVPTPGDITFPLLILLVFFFLLIPVNGHTRAMWVWLSITGNATIGPDTGTNTASSSPSSSLAPSVADIATSAAQIDTTAQSLSAGIGIIAFTPGGD